MTSRRQIFLVRSNQVNWPSAEGVTRRWIEIYRSWQTASTDVKLFTLGKSRTADLRALKQLMVACSKTDLESHVVVVDSVTLISKIASWAPWFSRQTHFHFHLFTDVDRRLEELRSVRKSLQGRAYHCYVASDYVRSLAEKAVPRARIHVIPFPIADEFFVRKRVAAPKARLRVVYVGRIDSDKGVLELLKWWNRSGLAERGGSLSLVGARNRDFTFSGTPKHVLKKRERELNRELRSLDASVDIRLIHEPREMAKFLTSVDVQISLSRFALEGFGVAVAEGIACGLGVVLTPWRGHSAFREAPFIEYTNERELTRKVLRLATLTTRDRQRQRRWAKAHFSKSAISRALHKHFKNWPTTLR